MKVIKYPTRDTWSEIVRRPYHDCDSIDPIVSQILDDVRARGDDAVRDYGRRFDGVELLDLEVSAPEFASAANDISDELKNAILVAKKNIETFHNVPFEDGHEVETTDGVFCWRRRVGDREGRPLRSGRNRLLFSRQCSCSQYPARLAGCRETVMFSPPAGDGKINPVTLYAAQLCGVTKFYKIGGAQAIAAMTYGTKTVPSVYKIFGPGNQFVTEAKRQVSRAGVAIDMLAGPSELAVLADETANPTFVAADLLSQAEHGPDSQVLFLSTSDQLIARVLSEITRQITTLPRREYAEQALCQSKAVLVGDVHTGLDLINEYAPEHLIIATEFAEEVARGVVNAGSVFVGNLAC
jgi:histidinol dehydrogenase